MTNRRAGDRQSARAHPARHRSAAVDRASMLLYSGAARVPRKTRKVSGWNDPVTVGKPDVDGMRLWKPDRHVAVIAGGVRVAEGEPDNRIGFALLPPRPTRSQARVQGYGANGRRTG
jgi:hypothetical protein